MKRTSETPFDTAPSYPDRPTPPVGAIERWENTDGDERWIVVRVGDEDALRARAILDQWGVWEWVVQTGNLSVAHETGSRPFFRALADAFAWLGEWEDAP